MDGALGPVVFSGGLGSMNTFHSMNKSKKETLAKHRIIQAIDLIEDTGPKAIELSIQMHFHAPYTLAPSAAITALEALMDMRMPLPLIIGSTPIGRGFLTLFVIEDVASKMSKFSTSSLIIGDIEVKLCEYAGALSLTGPLSALGGGLPGLSSAVSSITAAVSGISALNIATTFGPGFALGSKVLSSLGPIGSSIGGVVRSLSGIVSANSLTSTLSQLLPGQLTQVTAPSTEMVSTAIANLKAAGHL